MPKERRKIFIIIYLLGFLWAISTALPSYIHSSFLQQFVSLRYVGLYITLATFLTLLSISIFPVFIRRFSNYRVMMTLLFLNIIGVLFLVQAENRWLVLLFFVIVYVSLNLLAINLDIFLENVSDDQHTGRIRSTFLTIMNIGWVISPLLMGFLTGEENRYWLVYLLAGLALLPAIVILFSQRRIVRDHIHYKNRKLKEIWQIISGNKNLACIYLVSLVLRFFYALMVLYTPIYLHQQFGFSWQVLGVVFTVMLLPFVILQMPAGALADKYLGEKEIMATGFLIMMIFTGMIFFLQSTSIYVWAAVLFMTRVGASLVEVMQESYFFKHVDSEDMDLISLFRDLRPAGWLLGSLVSVAILQFLPVQFIFLFLAIVLLFALRPVLILEDTK